MEQKSYPVRFGDYGEQNFYETLRRRGFTDKQARQETRNAFENYDKGEL